MRGFFLNKTAVVAAVALAVGGVALMRGADEATKPEAAAASPRVRPSEWAQPMIDTTLGNFFRVSDELYRSEQPEKSDLANLQAVGVKTIFSLRHHHRDSAAFDRAGIATVFHKMDAGDATTADMVTALRMIRKSPKPVLVHCWHGSDRTGFVVAGYRMVFQGWSAERACDELRAGGYGYHESCYPDILKTLSSMDVAAVRAAVMAADAPAT